MAGNQTNKPFSDQVMAKSENAENQQTKEGKQVVLTEEQLQELVQKASSQGAEEAFRRAQSYVDKQNQKVREAVSAMESTIASMRKRGIEVSPEQEEAMKAEAEVKAATANSDKNDDVFSPPAKSQDDKTKSQEESTSETKHPAIIAGEKLMEEMGVKLDEGDPEFKEVDLDTAESYLLTLPKALAKKAERVGVPPQNQLPGGGGSSGGSTEGLPDDVKPYERLSGFFKDHGKPTR